MLKSSKPHDTSRFSLSRNNNIPRKIRNMPPTFSTIPKYLENDFIFSLADPIPTAIKRNGVPNPNEKTVRSNPPCHTFDVVEASIKIDPKIGPTQGVQPKANEEPRRNELNGSPLLKIGDNCIFSGCFKNEILI